MRHGAAIGFAVSALLHLGMASAWLSWRGTDGPGESDTPLPLTLAMFRTVPAPSADAVAAVAHSTPASGPAAAVAQDAVATVQRAAPTERAASAPVDPPRNQQPVPVAQPAPKADPEDIATTVATAAPAHDRPAVARAHPAAPPPVARKTAKPTRGATAPVLPAQPAEAPTASRNRAGAAPVRSAPDASNAKLAVTTGHSASPASGAPTGGAEALRERYLADLVAAIDAHKHYPKASRRRREEGRVVVEFVVQRDGQLAELAVVETSGITRLDDAALKSLARVSPFAPIPPTLARDRWPMRVPIEFSLRR